MKTRIRKFSVTLRTPVCVCLHGVSRDCCWFDICDSIEREIINNEYAQYSSRFLVVLFCLVIGVICTIGEYEEKITQKFIYVVHSRFEKSLPRHSSIFLWRKLSCWSSLPPNIPFAYGRLAVERSSKDGWEDCISWEHRSVWSIYSSSWRRPLSLDFISLAVSALLIQVESSGCSIN